jgi:single-stranded-DNA-specific exonuclease
LTIRQEQIPAFTEHFEAAVRAATRPEDFIPETTVDAELSFADIGDRLIQDLAQLEPHGPGNPEPVFLTRGATVMSHRIVGENHLKLYLRHGDRPLSAIGFGMAAVPLEDGVSVDILFSPELNEWNGSTSLQLRLRDLRAATCEAAHRVLVTT